MRLLKLGVWSLALALFSETALAADRPQTRKGFWVGLGVGYGSADVSCDDCESGDREGSGAGFLKLGGTLNERVLLGGEVNLWTKEQEGLTVNLYNVSATVTFYPKPSGGFFIKGGAGLSFVDTELREGNTVISVDLGSGFGALAGAGYDIRVARNISLTPAFNFYYGRPGNLKFGSETIATNWKQNVFDVSLGITFH